MCADRQQRNRTTHLDGDVALSDLPHVEPNCRNHVFTELARLKHTHTHTHFLVTYATADHDTVRLCMSSYSIYQGNMQLNVCARHYWLTLAYHRYTVLIWMS